MPKTKQPTRGGSREGAGPPEGNQNAAKKEEDKVKKKLVSARIELPFWARLKAQAKHNKITVSAQVAKDLESLYPDPKTPKPQV